MLRCSRHRGPVPALAATDFLGPTPSPGVVVLAAHYVSEDQDAADSDSHRLRHFSLSTSVGRFCGVTFGDMPAHAGFFKHDFKPAVPTSDAELVCLDYFWMQRGGDWIKMRYGSNWRTKIETSFWRCPQLKAFIVPNNFGLFDDGTCKGVAALELYATEAPEAGHARERLTVSCINATQAETLHPLVVATLARDSSQSPHVNTWKDEGRVHTLQISRYSPEGFLIVHRFASDALLHAYLSGICAPPTGA